MKGVLSYLFLGLIFLLLQTTVLGWFLPPVLKPDLLLILLVYLALNESYSRGGALAYVLGGLNDVFAGSFFGFYGLLYLTLFIVAKGAISRLNAENTALLLLLVFLGAVLKGVLALLVLGLLADPGPVWPIIIGRSIPQALSSFLAALALLQLLGWLQKRLRLREGIPGLQRIGKRHGI